jgi:hypothetical protein
MVKDEATGKLEYERVLSTLDEWYNSTTNPFEKATLKVIAKDMANARSDEIRHAEKLAIAIASVCRE